MSKYRNTKVCHGGEKFDSIAEYTRYRQLKLLEQAGEISDLKRQVSFELAPKIKINGKTKTALRYVADFTYKRGLNDNIIVEDVKGFLTAVYKIKRHLMKSIFNIDILETK